jgi:hypothetical protein
MNTYCGPFALAYVCGITTDEAAERIRAISGQRVVKGVYGHVLAAALRRHSKVIGEVKNPGMRLHTWAKVRQKWRDAETWVVCTTGHFLIYRDGVVYDNQHPDGRPIEGHRYAKARLKWAHCVQMQAPAGAAPTAPPAVVRPEKRAAAAKPKPTTAEKRAMALARVNGRIARWESKRKRAENALVKLLSRRRAIARAMAAAAKVSTNQEST